MQVVLKVTSILLKRIGRPLRKRSDILFLLITLENPFLFQHIYKDEPNNIIKRTFGYISSLSNKIHRYIINWFCNYDPNILYKKIQLCNNFISKRLHKYLQKRHTQNDYNSDWRIKVSARMIALLCNTFLFYFILFTF